MEALAASRNDIPTEAANEALPTVDLQKVLADKESKEYADFRDRAAYVYATGTFPTHLRRYFTGLLRMATRYSREAVALDKRGGRMEVNEELVRALELEDHPMIRKVRQMLRQGYHIRVARDLKSRRPYSKVFMYARARKGTNQITVQADGSIKEGWA